ncbi:GNAT family N-acetyltransferase [Companilactobacillus mishanensis]|uniref:GNAT family N-acetyltransferase n=1 Tax=Companilactobacillus mishanensis TaxID=2486008 RepID=UPI001295D508|nr:GNAT family N-acetyltransferase [Companilactobacillus mishanensis]MQS90103.1 GNAT family N-acetyltransferase [Companilactobacillus mishanensis]
MSLTVKAINSKVSQYNEIKNLFKTAFPHEERTPWLFLRFRTLNDNIQFLAFYDNKQFVGLSYVITWKDITYVFYLAVNAKSRSHGYGGEILKQITNMYPNNRIFLCAEKPDDTASKDDQKHRRIRFYNRNGFVQNDYTLVEGRVKYVMLTHDCVITKDEYIGLLKYYAFPFGLFLNPKFA